ncbi:MULTISPECIES: DUF5681 domain-containing protein [unclassified Mesorhizobium]|uniref:DUF5681 domain-containing protein n=1 Tax=unclassified Mesorhizobium TaxID=325217 RepID=UPI000FCB5171|nr:MULTISPECIES: DUF5681 domain-containing protein [unclassified Mesorhizobium]RUV98956.1 hypothetical protein EOA49_21930 [Mesorhizobium sp. M1A.F.Ca.IN.020.04.1.1]RUW07808.1 hypothetical protein EOA53_20215 [Mesorhizobium sp. M1A.F.Ca.IN.020.03.1.1]RWF71653.1 MAG: hypothetical protein EOQ34_14735 [Mesorhizobium sp.]RWG12001.1 MAG: hypothetical protein EOQ58_22290 [Mesorhizobium sp.]RWG29051.1 MAG: hypothetical protein EOQ61_19450 [Mesorhizobium sp.]
MSGSDDDYEVGYGKPPKQSRFKPGRSGNPRGRPKEIRSIGTELIAELRQKVTIRENGVERRITKAAALAKSVVGRALKGDNRAFGELVKLLPQEFKSPINNQTQTEEPLSDRDREIVENFVARRLQSQQAQSATATKENKDD